MFTLSSSPASVVQRAPLRVADTRVKSMKRSQIPGKKCPVIATASHNVSRRDAVAGVFGSSVAWALPSLAFGISSDAKADLAASRDAKKAAILAAARAKAEGQAANVASQEQDSSGEAPPKKALQPASFFDASTSGAGVRGGGPAAGNTYEVTKQATPAPAPPAAAPEPASSDDGGFGLPSVSLPSLPKLPF